MNSISVRLFLVLTLCVGSGCVRYVTQRVDLATEAEQLGGVPDGPLAFEDAVRLLVHRHPELRAARARIAAVNLDPGPEPFVARVPWVRDEATEVTLETDLLSLVGIGPRAAEQALARAFRDERVRAYHERARNLIAELAEAYAVEAVLRSLEPPAPVFDVGAFEQAGLASTATLRAARAAMEEAVAEGDVIAAELADARRRIVELVAARPEVTVEPVPTTPDWPPLVDATPERLTLTRGDLLRLYGQWVTADHEFRVAVARQIPGLELRLGRTVPLDLATGLVRVRLPIDAPDEARVAQESRRAAYEDLRGGILAALHDAESRHLRLDAALASVRAARARAVAARALLEGEQARLATDPDALATTVLVLGDEIAAERALRQAAVSAARARVRAARAAGWPAPEVVDDAWARATATEGGDE